MSSDDEPASPPPPMGPPPTAASGGNALQAPDSPDNLRNAAIARLDFGLSRSPQSRNPPTHGPPSGNRGLRAQPPMPDAVAPSRIREAANTRAQLRLRLNDPNGTAVAGGGGAVTNTPSRMLLAPQQRVYTARVNELTVRTPEGDYETIQTHVRPDGVEVVSRGVQSVYTSRHKKLGIAFRGHPFSKVVILLLFIAPLIVVLSIISYYVNWRQRYQTDSGNASFTADARYHRDTSYWLLYLCAANFYQLLMTYLCVLPTCFKCLTNEDDTFAERDEFASVATFTAAFLPVWIGEVGIVGEVPYARDDSGLWASIILSWGGGIFMWGSLWYVYSVFMAELMHTKAKRAANEYLRAIQQGYYRQLMAERRQKSMFRRRFGEQRRSAGRQQQVVITDDNAPVAMAAPTGSGGAPLFRAPSAGSMSPPAEMADMNTVQVSSRGTSPAAPLSRRNSLPAGGMLGAAVGEGEFAT